MRTLLHLLCSGLTVLGDVQSPCCQQVTLNVNTPHSQLHFLQGARLGFYSQIGFFGARPQYKQDGGNYFIFYSKEDGEWMNTEFHVGNTTSGLVSEASSYCVDSPHPWIYYNGSDWVQSEDILATCSSLTEPCCPRVNITSSLRTNSSLYSQDTRDSLGLYTAVGLYHGRHLYQQLGLDRYLLYLDTGDWLVTDSVGHDHGYLSHTGGSVCPEDTDNTWEVSIYNQQTEEFTWDYDTQLTVECVQEQKKEAPRAGDGVRSLASTEAKDPDRGNYVSPVIIVLSLLSLLLVAVFVSIFSKRFYKAWSHGAHGKQLFRESFSVN